MIGLDTNVLARYIAQDDRRQSAQASALIDSLTADAPGFVSLVVLAELTWVLHDAYERSKDELVTMLDYLLRAQTLRVEQAEIASKALRLYVQSKADFADCLVCEAGLAAGCKDTVTFDAKAAKLPGMRLASAAGAPPRS